MACNAGELSSIPGSRSSPGDGIGYPLQNSWASLVVQIVKNPPAMWETWVGKLSWRGAWQTTPVFLPGESPWAEEPGGLQSVGSQRVRHDRAQHSAHTILHGLFHSTTSTTLRGTHYYAHFTHRETCSERENNQLKFTQLVNSRGGVYTQFPLMPEPVF